MFAYVYSSVCVRMRLIVCVCWSEFVNVCVCVRVYVLECVC